jgi:polysaccharide chain length determinant protein (PEP-CTERM system associated)
MNVESGLQFFDLRGVLRRRGKVAAATGGLVVLAAYWLAMALPNQYESYATVLVEPQSVSPDLVKAGVAASDLNERLHLMSAQILSRPRLSRIIDEIGLYEEESKEMVREEVIDLMRSAVRVEPVLPELERDRSALRRNSEINQFKIFFHDRDASVAMRVAQRLANDFIEEHISDRVKVSQKSLEFIEAELERVTQRMTEIEAKVASIKAENPGRLPEDVAANQRHLERLVTEISRSQREYDMARSEEAFWRSQEMAAASLERPNDDSNPTRKLQLLELQVAEFKAKGFTEKHPDYLKVMQEIEAIRASLATRESQRESEEREIPPNYQQQIAGAEIRRAELQMQSAQEEIDRLQARAESFRTLLAETPRVAEQLDALGREYQSQLDSYQLYIVRQQEASVQADMERRQLGEQFRVLEAAFIAPNPTSPNRTLIIILALFFAVALGTGTAVMLEVTDASVHSARQLQALANLPVLGSIPQIWLESDRIARRRSLFRQVLAASAVVGFVIVGGAANYAWVNGMPGFVKELLGEKQENPTPAAAAPAGQGG